MSANEHEWKQREALGHSSRKAMRGSTAPARNTGAREAKRATAAIPVETATKVAGSKAETPNSNEERRRVAARAISRPAIRPIPVRRAEYPRMSLITSRRFAPKAIRRPISGVRWETTYDNTL